MGRKGGGGGGDERAPGRMARWVCSVGTGERAVVEVWCGKGLLFTFYVQVKGARIK